MNVCGRCDAGGVIFGVFVVCVAAEVKSESDGSPEKCSLPAVEGSDEASSSREKGECAPALIS